MTSAESAKRINHELLVIITNYACSLRCKDCSNFIPSMPGAERKKFLDPQSLANDLRRLGKVVRFERLQIQGGESTLHPKLSDIIDVIGASGITKNIQLVTNGTHLIAPEVIESLKRNQADVRLSNYGVQKQRIENVATQLRRAGVEVSEYKFVRGDSLWFDMGGVKTERTDDDASVKEIFDTCPFNVCWTLGDGLLTKCSRSAAGHLAGQHEFFPDDFVNVRGLDGPGLQKSIARLKEDRFMEACRYCGGVKGKRIQPGIQLPQLHDSLEEKDSQVRAAFYYSMKFQLRVLEPIASEFQDHLITDDLDAFRDWHPDVVFTSDGAKIPDIRKSLDGKRTLIVGLRHGVANKYIPVESEYSQADFVCGSEWDEEDFKRCGVWPKQKFLTTGNPWVDEVFRILPREPDTKKPTILFAPTYNPEVSAAFFFRNDLVPLIRSVYPDSKIIIKPHPAILDFEHPYVREHAASFKELVHDWERTAAVEKNVRFISDSSKSIGEFFSEADLLISDGSSLIFEFMALGRPILLYTSDKKVGIWRSNYDDKALANGRRDVGIEFRTVEDFLHALANAFDIHNREHKEIQAKYSREIFGQYTDGESYKRVANSVKEAVEDLQEMRAQDRPRLVAFHLPQYHPIPENDAWWGKGFTEWRNVSKARPLFEGHHQPQLPTDLGFYDLRLPETLESQANMAREYGIEAFCFWHYWFNGKLLLERPLVQMLDSKSPDFRFCLAWANENWTRRWDGWEKEVLQRQEYGGEADALAHFEWLLPFFKDPRAFRIDGKPVFLIYRPGDLPDPQSMISTWRNSAAASGLDGLFLIAIKTSFENHSHNWKEKGFDGELFFQPDFDVLFDQAKRMKEEGRSIVADAEATVVEYKYVWPAMAEINKAVEADDNLFASVVPGWDNTARRSKGAMVIRNQDPNDYASWLTLELGRVKNRDHDRQIVFINAWNEWAEGNHLEPDNKFGRAFLEATLDAVSGEHQMHLSPTSPHKRSDDTAAEIEDSLDAKFSKAQILIEKGEYDAARTALASILDADPNHAGALNDIAVLFSVAGEPNKSIEMFRRLLEIQPDNLIARKNLGRMYLSTNELQEGLKVYLTVLKSIPDDVETLTLVANICSVLGLKEDAILFYKSVLEFDPANQLAASGLMELVNGDSQPPQEATAEISSDQTSTAAQQPEQVKAEHVDDQSASQTGEPSSLPTVDLNELYNESQKLIASGRNGDAAELLVQILTIEPDNPSALNDLAVLCSIEGKLNEAITLLNKLITIDPANSIARKNLGSLLLRANRIEEALMAYQGVLERTSYDTQALLAIATICAGIGKTDEAGFLFKKVLMIDPHNATAAEGLEALSKVRILQGGSGSPLTDRSESYQGAARCAKVSIVIPVFNKFEFTRRCLDSIFSNVHYSEYEIIVVDNASSDGTKEFMSALSAREERVVYIRNEDNLGFVGACNEGADKATGDYILLLNNDTQVNENWLEALVSFAEATPDCGAVGSKLIYPDGRLQEAGGIIFKDGNGWNYGRGSDPAHPKFNFIREVDYISGASLMVRRKLWDEIGGLDMRYAPAYCEDSDMCFEIRKRGYKVYYQPRSSVVHFEGATSGTDLGSGFKKYQLINRPKFIEKWRRELKDQYPNDVKNVEKASSRGIKKRILVADPTLPMFDRAAGSLHLFNILQTLRKMNFHVTFISGNRSLQEYYKPILENLGIETYAGDHDAMFAAGYVTSYPKINYTALFREREFDFALIDFWHHAEYYLPVVRRFSPSTTVIIDTEDVHFVRELREAELKNDPELKKKAAHNKKRETAVYNLADRLWVVTPEDREAVRGEVPGVPIDIRPVIHSLPQAGGGFDTREGLLFVGNFNHRPNIDAATFFVNEVMPLVAREIPDVVLRIVGNDPGKTITSLASKNVEVLGYVEDLSQYYGSCRLSVAPLRYGAGLKGKVVEALSFGVPIVTTTIGVEGTGLVDGQNILVADSPEEIASKIVDAYTNRDKWQQLSVNGRHVMQERWSFDAGRRTLEDLFAAAEKRRPEKTERLSSIVILTFNQLEYTKLTIDSIRKHTRVPYELIVVDNASTDGTVEYLKSQKDVRSIFNSENLGFPAGCNQGIEAANGDYVVLLNNDVIVPDNWLDGLIECAETFPQVGIVGPMSNRISGFQFEPNATYKKTSQVNQFAANYRRKNRKKWIEAPRVAGFCMLIKREVIDRIGGLDISFGIGNCEDDDYCVRSNLAGYKNAIAGDVFIHHFGSKSFGKDGLERYKEFIRRNESIFKEKWGVTPLEWWREGKSISRTSPLYVPLSVGEPVTI